jgi:hypothetical protein
MHAVEFIVDTFSHFVKHGDGPPPGIPAHTGSGFEQELLRLSDRQRLAPVVLHSLEHLVLKPDLSGLSLEWLKRDAKRIERNNERYLSKLHFLSSLFRGKGISSMTLGGAAMSQMVYPDPALRCIDRMDYIINELDWAGVLECLNTAGFEPVCGARVIDAPQEALRYHQLSVPCVFEDGEGDSVHVSFRLFHMGFPEKEEKAWTRSLSAEKAVPFDRVAGPEDQLIRYAVELVLADFTNLRLVLDIALLLEQHGETLDWPYITGRIRDRGHYASVYFAVRHVVDMLQLPDAIAGLPSPGGLRRWWFRFAWNPAEPDYPAAGHTQRNLKFMMLESRSLVERGAFIREVLSPAGEWVSAFYGRPSNWYLTLQFIARSLGGQWMKTQRPQKDREETHLMKPGRRLPE